MTVREERDPRTTLRRALLAAAAGGVAVVVGLAQGLRRLDVALWAVLVPLVVAALLELLPLLGRHLRHGRRSRAAVVVPDQVQGHDPYPLAQGPVVPGSSTLRSG